MDSREVVLDVLRKAYQIEVNGYTFYSMTAERAENPAVEELFGKLADDEVKHQAFLKSVAQNYDTKGLDAFRVSERSPGMRTINQTVLTASFREQASAAEFELGVLSIGMTLETNAIKYFSGCAATATDQEVKGFYDFLADWEKQHFEALQGIYNSLRTDVFADGGFAPF